MFEKIVLRRSTNGPAISIGELAEAILFYQNVHLILDHGSLCELVEKIRMEGILNLLSRKNITAVYCEETLGISTTKIGAFEYHKPVGFWISGSENGQPLNTRCDRLILLLSRYGYDKKQCEKLAEAFINRVPLKKLESNDFVKGGVVKAASQDFILGPYAKSALRKIIESTLGSPVLDDEFQFDIYQSGEDFVAVTNVNVDAINESRKRMDPEIEDVSRATFLSHLLSATADIHLAAHYGGELYTSSLSSSIICLRHEFLLRRIGIHQAELNQFHEIVLPESPMLSEVINSGERTFDDFLKVLDRSQKFRDWIQKVNPDEKLVAAYLREVSSEGWINSLKGKGLRYILGSAIGAVSGPLVGLAVGATDSFIIDKIFKGWRPSHFVDNTYRPFIGRY